LNCPKISNPVYVSDTTFALSGNDKLYLDINDGKGEFNRSKTSGFIVTYV
jgi:hypothetical protein